MADRSLKRMSPEPRIDCIRASAPGRAVNFNSLMVEMTATVQNNQGIHCRPSGVIFKASEDFKGEIVLKAKGMEVKLTSIMDIIVMGLFKGDSVLIRVSGKDEDIICRQLVELFEKKYDFPAREKC